MDKYRRLQPEPAALLLWRRNTTLQGHRCSTLQTSSQSKLLVLPPLQQPTGFINTQSHTEFSKEKIPIFQRQPELPVIRSLPSEVSKYFGWWQTDNNSLLRKSRKMRKLTWLWVRIACRGFTEAGWHKDVVLCYCRQGKRRRSCVWCLSREILFPDKGCILKIIFPVILKFILDLF